MMIRLPLAAALTLCLSAAFADEGMWTFNNFPAAKVGQAYGFTPDQAWLDHVRMASVRIAGGCSASLVSASGLVMTNHHCARRCVESVSVAAKKDFHHDGFLARAEADEQRCPGMEIDQLAAITDVTLRVQAATKAVAPEAFADARKGVVAEIEKACAGSDEQRCEVVTLYHGGRYELYRYRRFQDVRLVFAPEDRAAFFGGDPDNFNFPRYDLDVSFLRLYGGDGAPVQGLPHLGWSDGALKEGDLTFVAGNPGGTSRGLTIAQLEDDRDWRLPQRIARLAELRGLLAEYQERGPEQRRQASDQLFGVENALKAMTGRHEALAERAFWAGLVKDEGDFRARVLQEPSLQYRAGGAWSAIDALVKKMRAARKEYVALEEGPRSQLFTLARDLLRYPDETAKPNGERLQEFSDARLPQMRDAILANRPIYDELEIATLAWSLAKLREDLGADHPFVRRVLGKRSPAEIAAAAVKGTKLKDLKVDARGNAIGGVRKQLLDGGKAAVDAAHDPMIELARAFDDDARAIRRRVETGIEGPLHRQQELLAQARFAIYGDAIYPDATFTPRLSYGAVKGWIEDGAPVAPFTTLAGAFERATGAEPFQLPESWTKAKPRLKLDTPLDFTTTNDIIGGNSGSPVVDRRGDVVGLVFDGNIHSLGGEYGYDAALNRAVAVHSAALLEVLDKVYGAQRIVDELKPSAKGGGAR